MVIERVRWDITAGAQDPATVRRLLALLPHWFGIESSNAAYVESARTLPTYLAWPAADTEREAEPAGVLLMNRHFPESAEIHLLAVDPRWHRSGAGRALVTAAASELASDGCTLLQVKTRGPSAPDTGYARTREFYSALGFLPLEETNEFWGPENPCLIMVKQLLG